MQQLIHYINCKRNTIIELGETWSALEYLDYRLMVKDKNIQDDVYVILWEGYGGKTMELDLLYL